MLDKARKRINKLAGEIVMTSSIYETEPWGFNAPEKFLNQVLEIETFHEPKNLLKILQRIENDLGRKRITGKYESRVIDIDILFYDDLIVDEKDLVIPHPKITQRMFVLKPLIEIAANLSHPVTGQCIKHLYEQCPDKLSVKQYSEKASKKYLP